MKRDERKVDFFCEKSNPSDESAQNVSKQYFSDELFLDFSFESSESYCDFYYLHDSNSICRAAGIISEGVFDGTVLETSMFASWRKARSAPGIKLSQNVCDAGKRLWSALFPTCS